MIAIHHVQVACPPGGEDQAREFWVDGFGFVEVAKPAALAGRGGCWFRSFDPDDHTRVLAEIHIGVEEPFAPARKAHPAFVTDATTFAAIAQRLTRRGWQVDDSQRDGLDGYLRFHCFDPFGNRVEVLTPR